MGFGVVYPRFCVLVFLCSGVWEISAHHHCHHLLSGQIIQVTASLFLFPTSLSCTFIGVAEIKLSSHWVSHSISRVTSVVECAACPAMWFELHGFSL